MASYREYFKLPGTSERRMHLSGEEISRHAYYKLKNEEERQYGKGPELARHNPREGRDASMLASFIQEKAKEGIIMSEAKARNSTEYRAILDTIRNSKDNSHDGPKAWALVRLGRRKPDDPWDVGETPRE